MKILVSVVIIHWNTPNSLKKLLRSFQSDKKLQVTAVDNNSNKSVSWISKEFPRISLIQNKKNLGYAAAYPRFFLFWIRLIRGNSLDIQETDLLELLSTAVTCSFLSDWNDLSNFLRELGVFQWIITTDTKIFIKTNHCSSFIENFLLDFARRLIFTDYIVF